MQIIRKNLEKLKSLEYKEWDSSCADFDRLDFEEGRLFYKIKGACFEYDEDNKHDIRFVIIVIYDEENDEFKTSYIRFAFEDDVFAVVNKTEAEAVISVLEMCKEELEELNSELSYYNN